MYLTGIKSIIVYQRSTPQRLSMPIAEDEVSLLDVPEVRPGPSPPIGHIVPLGIIGGRVAT